MEENSSFGSFLLGLGLGVAAGILLAPKSGAETREYLRSRANDSGDYIRKSADEGREYLKKKTDDIRDSANDLVEKGRTAVKTRRENLNAAVEAGKQAYRDAVGSFGTGEGV